MLRPSGQDFFRHLTPGLLALFFLLAACLVAPASAHAYQGYDARQIVINKAQEQAGKKYEWAGAGPNTFDCSGLTMYSYAAAGISLPHKSGLIWSMCDSCTADALEPGDLVFRARLASGAVVPTKVDQIYHVGIYVGGGRVFEASSVSKPIGWSSLGSFKVYGKLKAQYWSSKDRGYDQSLIAHGDFTGDGREDVASVVKTGPTAIRIDVSASTATTMAAAKHWYVSSGAWDWDRTKLAAGDFNGDKKCDLALVYGYSDGSIKVTVFPSTGTTFGTKAAWWTGAAGTLKWGGLKLSAGDVTGDKKADLVAAYGSGDNTTRVLVWRSTGSAFTESQWWGTGTGVSWPARAAKIAVGDVTGDGKADVTLFRDTGHATGLVYLLASNGGAFTNKGVVYSPARYTFSFGRVKMQLADMNGDRKADLVYLYDLGRATSKIVWARSAGTRFDAAQVWWSSAQGSWDWERSRFAAADVDKNGRAEVLMMYDMFGKTSRIWRFSSVPGGAYDARAVEWASPKGALDWDRVK